MNIKFTIDDLDDLPSEVKQILKQQLSHIRFTKDAENSFLSLLKCIYKNETTEILLANIIMRLLEFKDTSSTKIISSNLIITIINEENTKLLTPIND